MVEFSRGANRQRESTSLTSVSHLSPPPRKIMNPTIVVHYRGFTLTPFEHPSAGYRIEVAPDGSDRSTFTSTFAQLDDALAEARKIVDWQCRSLQ